MSRGRKAAPEARPFSTAPSRDSMDSWQVAAALASALLHAGWNAAVKAGSHPKDLMTAQMVLSAAIVLPGLLWTGLPAQPAWLWIAASTAFNLATVTALLRAYQVSGFGVAYPVVRALSVLLVVPLAALLSGETLSSYGACGIALISTSLLLLAMGSPGRVALPRRALGWIVLAGVTTAGYVICDAQGVRRAGSPLAYGFAVSITNAAAMFWAPHAGGGSWRTLAVQARRALPIAIASVTSYLLILWVWSRAAIAPAAALRDTSAVFALVIAIIWLKEPFTRRQLAAILLSAAAVPLLRMS
ncbi:EamA family transporter [Reyranella sp.]|uniref:EamA family transporter n=1 Tax=Reyranella sp. TaxID=1929291 RepID=UPI0037841B98